LISQFQKDTMDAATEFETMKAKGGEESISIEDTHTHESDIDHDDCEECLLSDLENKVEPMDEIEAMNQTSMFANKYEENTDLPTVANKLADIINELEKSKCFEKHYFDDFNEEFNDLPFEEAARFNQFEIQKDECIMGGNTAYKVDDHIEQNLQDEVYLSDDETDLLNTAMNFESDEIYMTDEENEDEQFGIGEERRENDFHLHLDLVN
jgi:hypothetical protein